MKILNNKGFTIVELLIAISVFSSLLIIIVYAFLYGLNTFSKAQIVSNTQETARSIEQNLTQSFSLTASGSYYLLSPQTYPITNPKITVYGFCLGQYRYSYVLDSSLSSTSNYGMIQDTYSGCNSSTSPADLTKISGLKNARQLLGNNMRIGRFQIDSVSNYGTGYRIRIEIDYGTNLIANNPSSSANSFSAHTPDSRDYVYYCPSGNISASFCAVAKIDTTVFQRIQ